MASEAQSDDNRLYAEAAAARAVGFESVVHLQGLPVQLASQTQTAARARVRTPCQSVEYGQRL